MKGESTDLFRPASSATRLEVADILFDEGVDFECFTDCIDGVVDTE